MVTETNDGVPVGSLYAYRPIALYTSGSPGPTVWHTVLEANDVCVQYVTVFANMSLGATADVETEITVDGVVFTDASTFNDSDVNYFYHDVRDDVLNTSTTKTMMGDGMPIYASSFMMRVMTTELDADVDELRANVRYYQR